MISRLMLSLKKASRDKDCDRTSDALSGMHVRTGTHMEFVPNGVEDGLVTTSDEAVPPDSSYSRAREKGEEEKV